MKKRDTEKEEFPEKTVRAAAVVTASGVIVCGVCCVLPVAVPAVALAGAGSTLAWMGGAQSWATIIAAVVVTGAWGWIGWQAILARAKPARATLYMMVIATAILMLGFLWPRIEPLIVSYLRA